MNNDNIINMHFDVVGNDFSLAGEASSNVKSMLKQIGIKPEYIKKTSIAMYEAEMNMVIHADGGKIDVEIAPDYIKVVFLDSGPGIPDIELAMKEGYSTAPDRIRELGFGAGMGLPNIKRYSDEFKINSEIGKGTVLSIVVFFKE
jgi:anti-sigma regulatory factor (Ser/Thr protein kinase)